ncbi:MAG: SpoIID/LytB domain-containing protein [Candidatus Omnitrophica bacterium]|nr:SpoIID/LytB domain-containing protein [Candidatus Omnitrophota bacterium]
MKQTNKKQIVIIIIFLCLLFSRVAETWAQESDVYLNHLYRARVFFNLGEYEQAIKEYSQAKKIEPGDKITALNSALIYKNMRLYKKAEAMFKELLKRGQSGILFKNLGEVYFLDSMTDEAISSFNKALEMGVKDASLYFWLGRCFEDKKETQKAVDAYRQAVALEAEFAIAHLCLANIYIKNKMWDEAQQELEETEKLDPSMKDVYPALMDVYFNQRRYEQALSASRKVQAVDPDNAQAKKYISEIHRISGKELGEKLQQKESARMKGSFAKKVALKKAPNAPIVGVHIGDVKRLCFKTGADFSIEDIDSREVLFQGQKNKLYALTRQKEGIALTEEDKKILDFKKGISIVHNDPRSTILIFDVEAGKGQYWASKSDRVYRGKLEINPLQESYFNIINVLDMEEYLYGVLPSEMPSSWPREALRAQAVAARSEAYRKINRHKEHGYDFCSGVHCQAYNGAKVETAATNAAIDSTIGLVAVYNGKPIDAVYSNSCGGHTQGNIFAERIDVPYLQHKQDSFMPAGFFFPLSALELEDWLGSDQISVFCNNEAYSRKSNFRWQRLYTRKQLEDLINKKEDIGRLISIDIKERHPSSHVHSIKIKGSKGELIVEKELNIRNLLGDLRSAMFNIDVKLDKNGEAESFLFYGGGWGHGVGMCQVGAATMAQRGFDFQEILEFYYTDIKIEKLY